MAVTRSQVVAPLLTTADQSSYSTSVPSAGTETRTHLVFVFSVKAAPATIPTLSGGGLTWTQVASIADAGNGRRITVFRARGQNTAAAVAAAFGGVTQLGCHIYWYDYDNADPSTDEGVRQSKTAAATAAASVTVVFDSAVLPTSHVTSGAVHSAGTNSPESPPYTEIADNSTATPSLRSHIQASDGATPDSDPKHTADAGTSDWAAIAVEVKAFDSRADVSWAELETPAPPGRADVSWAEMEAPSLPGRADVSWAEMEVPTPGRADVSWAELETPAPPGRADVSWAEMEAPNFVDRFFLPPSEGPLIPPKSQWKDTKIPSTAMLRMIDFRRGRIVTIGGTEYHGGRWYGPLTQQQIDDITAAGYGDRLVALDDIGDRPAGLG